MGYSAKAMEEIEREAWLEDISRHDSFKFGYCRSAINTALWFYDLGHTDQAIKVLRDCAEMMREKVESV